MAENQENSMSEFTTINTVYGPLKYRPEFKLTHASFMQLLYCYNYRLSLQKPDENNKWQQYAYPKITEMFQNLVNNAETAINALLENPEYDKNIVTINFCGYNFKLPLIVYTQGVHHKATYGTVNVRPFLKTLEQRLGYLATMQVPNRYKDKESDIKTFKKVQETAQNLLDNHVKPLYDAWNKLCEETADYAGIELKKHEPRKVNKKRFVKTVVKSVAKSD